VAVRAAVHAAVVHDNELAVGGGADVGFDEVGARLHRGPIGRHGVLGVMQMLAAMGNGHHGGLLRERGGDGEDCRQ
jgi:hypothetical protein